MPEKAVRKTTVKKTVRKTAPKKAVSKTASRTVSRRAPTPVAAQKIQSQYTQRITIAGVGVFVIILAVSIFIGFSGDGQISINQTITEQKEAASPEELDRIESIPVQQAQNTKPDGGLVPSGVPLEKVAPPVVPTASSTDATASSSDTVASSSDAVSEDVEEEVLEEEVVVEEEVEPTPAEDPGV
ncbi:MAG: hypothetical protein ACI9H6_000769 [Patiriisocius sp.]|jgi:hypothetical protein